MHIRRRRVRRPRRRVRRVGSGLLLALLLATLGAVLAAGLWLFAPYWQLSAHLKEEALQPPSRLYAASPRVANGMPLSIGRLETELERLGYRPTASRSPAAGEFRAEGDRLLVHQRAFPTPSGVQPQRYLGVVVSGRRVQSLQLDGRPVDQADLEPSLLYTYYDPHRLDRWPEPLEALPEHLVRAVLAAEDARFFRHTGLSVRGILRAAWVNLRDAEVRQGGSTLTQQLVKNLYLTHERTLNRKLREATLATVVELRYDKPTILQAYLNEIYWGKRAGVNLMGIGSASRAYFNRTPQELTLGQAALLAAIIRAPGDYDPALRPQLAQQRRDWVLDRMVEHGWLEAAGAELARREPVATVASSPQRRRAPFFAEAARREAIDRYGIDPRTQAGRTLLSTLVLPDQETAEEAVAWGLEALEEGWEKGREMAGPLQAALVSAHVESGEILAYVGGRDFARSQFDRAGHARRQAGSAFKPVVYLTAFDRRAATPATLLDDAPLEVRVVGGVWSPSNFDRRFHGWVTARDAVVKSYNVATARLALQSGLPEIVQTAHGLGLDEPMQPVPSLALGAFAATPVQMATAYATLAAGGLRPTLHGLRGVLDREGQPLPGRPVPTPERVASPAATYVVTTILQRVLNEGTGSEARRLGLGGPLAGKTGTSNEQRDSWFAGYSPERVAVVWVGYDDNAPTRLTGARAGVPIWARFMGAVEPQGGYGEFPQPPGVATALIDPLSGGLATNACPRVETEVFLEGTVPTYVCHLHGGSFAQAAHEERIRGAGWDATDVHVSSGDDDERRHPFRRWLSRVFGAGGEQ